MQELYAFAKSAWVVWMMLLFVAIVAWALWPANRDRFRKAAMIPLTDDDNGTDMSGPKRPGRGAGRKDRN